jgi:hypothetical protein
MSSSLGVKGNIAPARRNSLSRVELFIAMTIQDEGGTTVEHFALYFGDECALKMSPSSLPASSWGEGTCSIMHQFFRRPCVSAEQSFGFNQSGYSPRPLTLPLPAKRRGEGNIHHFDRRAI